MNISELKNNSYAPYSDSHEVAAIKGADGRYFPGVRVENISFPLSISATQNALFCCLSEGSTPATLFIDAKQNPEPALAYWKEAFGFDMADIGTLKELAFAPVLKKVDNVASTLKELIGSARVDQSNFPVSALLETESGYIAGVNIETTDWSRGLCAERVALAKAISYGRTGFKALHIYTRDGEYNSPCGACRQIILEHLPHHPVCLYHADGTTAQHFSSDLLPYSFQSSSLKNKHT